MRLGGVFKGKFFFLYRCVHYTTMSNFKKTTRSCVKPAGEVCVYATH